ncbi:MAG: DNA polymerase III subunit epsilon [Neisseriaceae bacterium]|nr:DNA polymerase III subunit epsilon [Neisseriaceae bacterium]MBP6861107.1 DNA polymerase III subunit epsilon [Neisseriaceae bacterium]
MTRQIILDTETTGLSARNGDRLVEFAGVEMIDRQLTGRYLHLYVNPERDIPAEASNIHGIYAKDVADKPVFKAVGQQIIDFLAGSELIIHNAPFDVGFLNSEFARVGLPMVADFTHNVIDTLKMAKTMFPGKKATLDALCDRFEVDRSNRTLHGALIDCELLAGVYIGMTRGQYGLDMGEQESSQNQDGQAKPIARPSHLNVIMANAEELAAHEAYVQALDKAVGGACLYRQATQPE